MAFFWSLNGLGKFGWAVTFIYVAGAALRLARFNTQIGSVDKKYFVGLPSPSAAAVVAGMVWCFHDVEPVLWLFAVECVLVAGVGVLMVSNILYHSFKDLDLKGRVPFAAILIVVLAFVVIAQDPATVLFAIFLAYMLSGPLRALSGGARGGRALITAFVVTNCLFCVHPVGGADALMGFSMHDAEGGGTCVSRRFRVGSSPESEVTPEPVFHQRRQFMKGRCCQCCGVGVAFKRWRWRHSCRQRAQARVHKAPQYST